MGRSGTRLGTLPPGTRHRLTLTNKSRIEATVPGGMPVNVVRMVTENSRALKFMPQGLEVE
jgi:hypothetical protein